MTALHPRVFEPDPRVREMYDRLYVLHCRLHDAFWAPGTHQDLSGVMKALLAIRDEVRKG